MAESLKNEETSEVLDTVARLNEGGKSAGPDALQGEHLKFGGNAVVVWLKEVLNALFGSIWSI